MLHTFVAHVQDKPGVLTRIASFCILVCLTVHLTAQTVHIRLVNEKTGKPVIHKQLRVVGDPSKIEVPTHAVGEDYTATIEATSTGMNWLRLEWIKNRRDDQWADYVNCWNEGEQFAAPLKDILTKGVVSENHCSTRTAESHPGELIIFVKQVHWWQKID
jgi:hypothetical protein